MNNKKFQETLEQLKEELEIQGVEFNDENDLIAAVEYIIEYDYPPEQYVEDTLCNYPEMFKDL